jgi:hypothetical protein
MGWAVGGDLSNLLPSVALGNKLRLPTMNTGSSRWFTRACVESMTMLPLLVEYRSFSFTNTRKESVTVTGASWRVTTHKHDGSRNKGTGVSSRATLWANLWPTFTHTHDKATQQSHTSTRETSGPSE